MEMASGDSFNGLKFGERIYFEDAGGSGSSSKSIGASAGKKGKGVSAQVGGHHRSARCQVEGCNLDLTGAKAYYCRHKVCGMHSKSPKVIVAGLEQRFCQQCSRRLAGHNERRRKQPPLGPSPSRYGRFFSYHAENSRNRSFLMDFNYRRPPGVMNQPLRFANPYPPALFSDSNCALSLLSTQPWGAASNLAAASRTNLNGAPVISGTTGFEGSGGQIAELNMTSSYMMNSPWDFKDDESGSSSLEMGIRHARDTGHVCFSGELGLALQGSDEFGHHVVYNHDHHQAMHWAL